MEPDHNQNIQSHKADVTIETLRATYAKDVDWLIHGSTLYWSRAAFFATIHLAYLGGLASLMPHAFSTGRHLWRLIAEGGGALLGIRLIFLWWSFTTNGITATTRDMKKVKDKEALLLPPYLRSFGKEQTPLLGLRHKIRCAIVAFGIAYAGILLAAALRACRN